VLSGRRRSFKELRMLGHRRVGRVALQLADLDRLALRRLADAGLLAQLLGGADPGAHAAEDVLLENRLGSAERIVGLDLADEQRDVDGGGAGGHARRVEAEIAAVGLDMRLVPGQRRVQVREVLDILLRLQASRGNALPEHSSGHRPLPIRASEWKRLAQSRIFINWSKLAARTFSGGCRHSCLTLPWSRREFCRRGVQSGGMVAESSLEQVMY